MSKVPLPMLNPDGVAHGNYRYYLTQSVLKSFCKSQFPHKSVNSFFLLVIVKDKLTDLWGS